MPSIKRLTLLLKNRPVDQAFFLTISAWFPALTHLSISTPWDAPSTDIQSLLSKYKLSFSLEIVDWYSVDTYPMED